MLAVVTVACLVSGIVIGALTSSENSLAILLAGLGTIVLFPIALVVSLLSVLLSLSGDFLPMVGSWQSTLEVLTAGAYGFEGWHYLVAAVPLWFLAVFQFAEEDAEGGTDSSAKTTTDENSATTTTDETDGSLDVISTSSQGDAELEADSSRETATGESQSDPLMSVDGIRTEYAQALRAAGYTDVADLRAADRDELDDVNGIGTALAARIEAEVKETTTHPEKERQSCAGDENTDKSEADSNLQGKKYGDKTSSEAQTGPENNASGADNSEVHAEDTVESAEKTPGQDGVDALSAFDSLERAEKDRLVEAGYATPEDLRTAPSSELAELVGYGTVVEIRRQAGYADVETGPTDETFERTDETDREDEIPQSIPREESAETDNPATDAAAVGPANRSTASESASLDEVESLLNTATTDPLSDPETTEAQLVRAHTKAVSLAEHATDQNRRTRVQETLDEIESRLDVLPELIDALDAARSKVSPKRGPSTDDSTIKLESTRDRYDVAIETASQGGFSTERLEHEREAIVAELKRRKSVEKSPSDAEGESRADDDADPSKQDLVEELQRLDEETDGYPLTTELRKKGEYEPEQYYERFGSWEEALEVAGIDKERRLVAELERVAELVDGSPSTVDMNEHGVHSSGTYSEHFGTWTAALEAAGLNQTTEDTDDGSSSSTEVATEPEYVDEPTEEDYIKAILQVAESTNRVVKSTDVSDQSPYSANEIISAFGSWQEALEAAGVDNEARLLQELRRVGDEVGHQPTTTEMNEHGHVSATMYANYFGSFTDARERAFSEDSRSKSETEPSAESDIDTEDSRGTGEKDEPTKADYVEAIQRVAEGTDRVIKSTVVSNQSPYSANEIISAFGSWQEALEAAGVDNEARLLQELRRVGDKVGQPPTTTEMNEHGHVSATMYANYFGSFTEPRDSAFSDSSGGSFTPSGASSTDGDRDNNSDTTHAPSSASQADSEDLIPGEISEKHQLAAIADISEDGRLNQPTVVKICEVIEEGGDRNQARLLVEDVYGDRCRLYVWRTHGIDVRWQVGRWYVLHEVRGKVWTTERGETKCRLSSTEDLRVDDVGLDRPFVDDTVSGSEPTDSRRTTSGPSAETATDESGSEDILDEVVSEFENLPDVEDS